MAEVRLFHHALGQTEGFHAFAEELRRAGHAAHAPDLYDGRSPRGVRLGQSRGKEREMSVHEYARREQMATDTPAALLVLATQLVETATAMRDVAVLWHKRETKVYDDYPAPHEFGHARRRP